MRRVHWLHIMSVVLAVGGAITGWLLVALQRPVVSPLAECPAPVHGQCALLSHVYTWQGIAVWVIAALASIILWRVGSNLAAGLSPAGFPRVKEISG